MKIAHIALWTTNLSAQVSFWQQYFGAQINEKYVSSNNVGFESYFINFNDGAAIELMTKPGLCKQNPNNNMIGWAHIAIAVGGKQQVDNLANIAAKNNILHAKPRITGDGYYEAILKDPDGNLIEIVS